MQLAQARPRLGAQLVAEAGAVGRVDLQRGRRPSGGVERAQQRLVRGLVERRLGHEALGEGDGAARVAERERAACAPDRRVATDAVEPGQRGAQLRTALTRERLAAPQRERRVEPVGGRMRVACLVPPVAVVDETREARGIRFSGTLQGVSGGAAPHRGVRAQQRSQP